LASQKGGTGKTTLSGHLAVEAHKAGVGPVALIDTDPQGSLSHWWNARAAAEPLFVKVGPFELGEALQNLTQTGIKLAVIDTPPAITESISSVIGHADLVILPTRPSPHDLRAVGATVDIADRHGKPVLFVVNAATQRARITGEAAVALSQHGTVAPVTLHHRVDFAASMVDGRTVGEVTAGSASAKEIQKLWIYVEGRLARLRMMRLCRAKPSGRISPSAAFRRPTPASPWTLAIPSSPWLCPLCNRHRCQNPIPARSAVRAKTEAKTEGAWRLKRRKASTTAA
jgi:chromosome partitioning protein